MSMSPAVQPFHIFRKDAMHLWPETLITIVLLPVFAWVEVQSWAHSTPENMSATTVLIKLASLGLALLLPIAWLVLTSRLVHDEELVGDRQFWITRPYTWYSLLSSKVFSLIVLIGLPMMVMQIWLLHHAGMYPTQIIPTILKNLLILGIALLLPLLVIAAVTATFVRYICSVLAGVIYLFIVIIFAAYLWSDQLDAPYFSVLLTCTLVAFLLVPLVLQYARRKTMIARIFLLALPLVFVVFGLFTPVNLLSEHRYPDVSTGKISFDGTAPHAPLEGRLFSVLHKNIVNLPVQIDLGNMSKESFVEVQRFRAEITGPNGFHYTSDWSSTRASLYPGETYSTVPISLPEKIFEQIHDKPVAIHLQLGTQNLSSGTAYTVTATEKPFPIPGHGTCTIYTTDGSLDCRFPYSAPDAMGITATVHDGTCQQPGQQTGTAFGHLPASSGGLHLSSVATAQIPLSVGEYKVEVCPGTPVTFHEAVEGAYGRMHLDIPAITLDSYAMRIAPRQGRTVQQAPPPANNQ
jgi:ABC-2 family transporter protein